MTPEQIQKSLALVHANYEKIMIIGGIAFVLGFVQFAEMFRLAYRHKIHAAPLFVILFWFANDSSYLLAYNRWFHVLNDPFFKNSWYLNFPYGFLELLLGIQAVYYGRQQIFPGFSMLNAYLAYAALQIAFIVFYHWMNTALDDYFFQIGNMLTLIGSNMGLYLLVQRRSRAGQSIFLAGLLVICAGALQFFGLFPLLDSRFQTPAYYSLAGLMSFVGVLYLVLLWRTPSYLRTPKIARAGA